MTDEEVRELSKKDWNTYWMMMKLVFTSKLNYIPAGLSDFLEASFKAGYLEGFRKNEELAGK